MSDPSSLPFLTRLWFAYVVFFRVLFNGEYAAQLHSPKALPEAKPEPKLPPKAEPKPAAKPEPAAPNQDAALQLLALLQREGRFVDFLEEDVTSFADAGNVQGKGPFSGTLRHRGWKAAEITMPTAVAGHDARILAQAEVEL